MEKGKYGMMSFEDDNDKDVGDFSIKDLVNQDESEDQRRSFEFGDSFNEEGSKYRKEDNSDESADEDENEHQIGDYKQKVNQDTNTDDSTYLNNLINNKIKDKMNELAIHNTKQNENSM